MAAAAQVGGGPSSDQIIHQSRRKQIMSPEVNLISNQFLNFHLHVPVIDRSEGLVPEEHDRLHPPKPNQWKGQRWSQHQGEWWGQRSGCRGRGCARPTEDFGCRPAVHLSDGGKSSSSSASSQTDAAAFSYVPRAPASRQVGVGAPVQEVTHLRLHPTR